MTFKNMQNKYLVHFANLLLKVSVLLVKIYEMRSEIKQQ